MLPGRPFAPNEGVSTGRNFLMPNTRAKSRFPDLLETLVVRRNGRNCWSRGGVRPREPRYPTQPSVQSRCQAWRSLPTSNRLSFVQITEGLTLKIKPTMTPLKVERDLSKLVNLRTGRKIISDARTATYVILSHGVGPGGLRFKSNRSDYLISRSLIDLHYDCVMFGTGGNCPTCLTLV